MMPRVLLVLLSVAIATGIARAQWIGQPFSSDTSGALGEPTSWLDVAVASMNFTLEVENPNASTSALYRAYDHRIEAIEKAGITDHRLVNPIRSPRRVDGLPPEDAFNRRLHELADLHPNRREVIRLDRSVRVDALALARRVNDNLERVLLRYDGWAPAWTARLAGGTLGILGGLGGIALVLAIGIGAFRQPFWIALSAAFATTIVDVALVYGWWYEVGIAVTWGRVGWLGLEFALICSAGWLLSQAAARAIQGPAPPSDIALRSLVARLGHARTETRLLVGFSLVWVLATVVVFLIFEPFGRRYWSDQEWLKFATILFGPVLVGLLAVRLYLWAVRAPPPKAR